MNIATTTQIVRQLTGIENEDEARLVAHYEGVKFIVGGHHTGTLHDSLTTEPVVGISEAISFQVGDSEIVPATEIENTTDATA